jgi:hypothetical protein
MIVSTKHETGSRVPAEDAIFSIIEMARIGEPRGTVAKNQPRVAGRKKHGPAVFREMRRERRNTPASNRIAAAAAAAAAGERRRDAFFPGRRIREGLEGWWARW